MLKIIIPLLVLLILYFAFRAKKGMAAIDNIYGKENLKNMEEIRIRTQQKLNENKIRKY